MTQMNPCWKYSHLPILSVQVLRVPVSCGAACVRSKGRLDGCTPAAQMRRRRPVNRSMSCSFRLAARSLSLHPNGLDPPESIATKALDLQISSSRRLDGRATEGPNPAGIHFQNEVIATVVQREQRDPASSPLMRKVGTAVAKATSKAVKMATTATGDLFVGVELRHGTIRTSPSSRWRSHRLR